MITRVYTLAWTAMTANTRCVYKPFRTVCALITRVYTLAWTATTAILRSLAIIRACIATALAAPEPTYATLIHYTMYTLRTIRENTPTPVTIINNALRMLHANCACIPHSGKYVVHWWTIVSLLHYKLKVLTVT